MQSDQQDEVQNYTVHGEKFSVGPKWVTVRCPQHFKRLLESRTVFTPIVQYLRKSKDPTDTKNTVTNFQIKLLDNSYVPVEGEPPRTYQVQFEVPEEVTSSVQWEQLETHQLGKLSPKCPAAAHFIEDVNDVLLCWSEGMKVKCDSLGEEVEYHNLSTKGVTLKWNSSTTTLADHIESMNPELNKFTIFVNGGYHSVKDKKIGISLSLSIFYGKTSRGAYLEKVEASLRNSKKRKVVALHPETGEEGEVIRECAELLGMSDGSPTAVEAENNCNIE